MNPNLNTRLEILAGHTAKFYQAIFSVNRMSFDLSLSGIDRLISALGLVVPAEQTVSVSLIDEEGQDSVPATLFLNEVMEYERGYESGLVLRAGLVMEFADPERFERAKRFLRRYSRENDMPYRDPDRPEDRILTSAEREALEPQNSLTALTAELARENSATITFFGYEDRGLTSEPYLVDNLTITAELLNAKRSPWKVEKRDEYGGDVARSIRIILGTSREIRLIQSKLLVWFDKDCFMLPLDNDALQRMLIERCTR